MLHLVVAGVERRIAHGKLEPNRAVMGWQESGIGVDRCKGDALAQRVTVVGVSDDGGGSVGKAGLVDIGADKRPQREARGAEDRVDGRSTRADVEPTHLDRRARVRVLEPLQKVVGRERPREEFVNQGDVRQPASSGGA